MPPSPSLQKLRRSKSKDSHGDQKLRRSKSKESHGDHRRSPSVERAQAREDHHRSSSAEKAPAHGDHRRRKSAERRAEEDPRHCRPAVPVGDSRRRPSSTGRSLPSVAEGDEDGAEEDGSAILAAATAGDAKALAILLDREPSMRVLSRALHAATERGRRVPVEQLLQARAEANCPNPSKGIRPIHLAAQVGALPVFRLLLDAAADPMARTKHGATAAQMSAEFGHVAPLEELCERGLAAWGPNSVHHPIYSAVEFGHANVIEFLVHRHGPSVADLEAPNGGRLIHLAASRGQIAVLNALLRHRAAIESRSSRRGTTPLMAAAANAQDCAVQVLLDRHGADLAAVDREDGSILHWACRGGSLAVLRRLLSARADVAAADRRGLSASDVAASERRPDLARELAAWGVPPVKSSAWHARRERFECQESISDVPYEASPMFGCEGGAGPSSLPTAGKPRICGLREADLKEIVIESHKLCGP